MAHKRALTRRFWEEVWRGVREENGPAPNSQMAKPVELSAERRQQILALVCDNMKSAGKGSIAAARFFGEIKLKRCPPLGIRRELYIGNLVETIGVSEAELKEFRSGITEAEKEAIHVAELERDARMGEFYRRESARMQAEMAQDAAAVM